MTTISVGFIGAGFSAHLHVEGLKQVHGVGVRLAAVTAGRAERAATFAQAHGVAKVCASWQELLAEPDIDAVCLCVPNALHAPIAVAAAKAGKHIICEKPMTGAFGGSAGLAGAERARRERERALASVAEIESAVRENGVRFLYAENWIYAPAMAKTKRLLKQAKGAIIDIRAEESHSGSHALRSRRRETAGGGALLMLGSHPIGAALHLKAYEGEIAGTGPIRARSVTAEVAALYDSDAVRRAGHGWLVSDWQDVETWSNLVIGFEDGTKAIITASFAMLGGVRNSFEVYTTNAVYHGAMTPNDGLTAFTPDPDAFGTEYLHEKIETRTGWISVAPDEDWVRGYPQEMQDFVEAIAQAREPASGLALASSVVDVIYAAYVSAEEGRRVDLDRS
ncbi:MAG: Gfo/Idh/MocA family protein [Inquilinus sp.]|uniref:Gfo/Idh/MocA family protein n=1 Tax=Inquilinus sp. TaxID=1932117 RepID=UPI003F3FB084